MKQAPFGLLLILLAARGTTPPAAPPAKPLAALTADELTRYNSGKALFGHTWSAAEGLGPYGTARGCSDCHNTEGNLAQRQCYVIEAQLLAYGAPTLQSYDFRLPFNPNGTPENAEIPANVANALAPLGKSVSVRRAKSVLGFGLVEAIADADILANLPNGGKACLVGGRVGRIGMKCQHVALHETTAFACNQDIGLTSAIYPAEPSLYNDPATLEPNANPGINITDAQIQTMTDFVRYSGSPSQTTTWNTSVMNGWAVFQQLGCAVCHVRAYVTHSDDPALDGLTIYPYSDFLLHDMGANADHVQQGSDQNGQPLPANHMRTAPLWGLRYNNQLWHDGLTKAGDYATAIKKHTGAAQSSQDAYNKLTAKDRNYLTAFLNAL